ncbi:MAG: hypothetical protein O7B99_11005 [Planctomycetota bacterium]|nr:hypothetical protein [Planctomycetota bacterium]
MRRRAVLIALVALAALPGACGGKPTLRTVMVRIEKDQLALESLLGSSLVTPEVLERIRSLERLSNDPSFAAYVDHWSFRGDRDEFEKLRAFYLDRLGETVRAAESGDGGAFRRACGRLRMACELCHKKFRPDFR